MRFLVVHAHLYQPPRENPWTEVIERQPSAAPFHDWSERVSDECYERLGSAAVHGPDGRIVSLVNLYGRISFNIGPTLAAWLEQHRPDALRDAAAGDAAARERTGHGSALMQPYGHPILPLCEPRERRLQIAWGRADFIHHFGHPPEGVWLPECAVDVPSLEACADAGLQFTVVAPEQVLRVRPLAGGPWEDVSGSRVPPHRPYLVRLPSGRAITVFVFDGPLSRGAAFGGRLSSGESLLDAFRAALDGIPGPDGMVLLAADGETFGHHQKGAENALAEALVRARLTGLAQVSHLGEVFQRFPLTHEAQLAEPSSWSCGHGVGRWERDCGCNAGAWGRPNWSWGWRPVLRHAMSMLRDRVFSLVDRRGGELFADPWAAAEDYGAVVVSGRSVHAIEDLLRRHARPGLPESEHVRAASLLELIRQTLFAATSCGWFFDDIAGLEAVQVLRHAARAVELTRLVFGIEIEPDLVTLLGHTHGNEEGSGSGADIFRQRALAARRAPVEAVASHAVRQLREALQRTQTPAAVSTAFGAYVAEDRVAPETEYDAEGGVELAGEADVLHLRTGVRDSHTYRVTSPGPGEPLLLEIDGEALMSPSPPVAEAMLEIAAWRGSRLLPAPSNEVLLKLAWIGLEARQLGAPLPSPFREALRGGGRALVQDLLRRPADAPRTALRALTTALAAARSAGLSREELAHLRPGLERQLAFYASWALQVDPDALADLAVAVGATRQAAGETVLGRIRRWVAETDGDIPEEALPALLAATGLAHDALLPLEGPVPPPRRNGKAAPAPAAADAAAAAPAAADPAQAGAVGAPAAGPAEGVADHAVREVGAQQDVIGKPGGGGAE